MQLGYTQTDSAANGNRFYKLTPAALSLGQAVTSCANDGAHIVGYETVDQRAEVRQVFTSLGQGCIRTYIRVHCYVSEVCW